MPVINVVRPNIFRDSIQLMRLTEDVKKMQGVKDAVVAMGTDTNKRLLQELGLLGPEGKAAADGDLMMAVRFGKGVDGDELMARVQEMVMNPPSVSGGPRTPVKHSISSALESLRGANLAIVSVPGSRAFEPSLELLRNGVNVHLFSDHVPIVQEIQLKKFASSKGLLVLGPGAGTSIIDGIGLGFANVVRRGDVGIVASAGTGIQEVSTILDRIGLGVSAALGVGGSDVSEEVGGLMTKDCIDLLEKDPATRAIMLVAKTPKKNVIREIMGHVEKKTTKPVVACFLGLVPPTTSGDRITYAKTLHSAVFKMSLISGREAQKEFKKEISISYETLLKRVKAIKKSGKQRRYVRGLYSGGTLAHETLLIFKELVGEAYSNTPLSNEFALEDPNESRGNSVIDLGDEFFTAGRAHPMIDPTLRRLRIAQEAKDPAVATILLDVVLGYGSSPDPGGVLQGAIKDATHATKGVPAVMAHVCGSQSDPQSLDEQNQKLLNAGALLFGSNALLAIAAALLVGGEAAASSLRKKWEELLD